MDRSGAACQHIPRSHLRHANHTRAFWNLVDKLLPDYQDRKEWLRVNGAGMDL